MSETRQAILVDGVGRMLATSVPVVDKAMMYPRKHTTLIVTADVARHQVKGDAPFSHLGATETGIEVYGYVFEAPAPAFRIYVLKPEHAKLGPLGIPVGLAAHAGPVRQVSARTWISRGPLYQTSKES